MAKAPVPVALISKNLTKEERESRQEQEKKLKGNSDKVYKVPKELNKEVGAIYKSLTKELKAADILNNLDIDLLSTTANAIYQMRLARKHIIENGSVITIRDADDNVIKCFKNPSVQVEKDYQTIFHTGVLQLGLSPSARAKLSIINVNKEKNEDGGLENEVFG